MHDGNETRYEVRACCAYSDRRMRYAVIAELERRMHDMAAATASCLTSVHHTPLDEAEDYKVGEITIITIGRPFRYMIPHFEVLQVELRHIVIEGETEDGDPVRHDCFIRNDASLCRAYPSSMAVRDAIVIPVSFL